MEPRNGDLKTTPEEQKAARPSRFQIVKLEERIAPDCKFNPNAGQGYHYHYHGTKYLVKPGKYVGKC